MMKTALLFSFALLALQPATADTIFLRNGDRLSGAVDSISGGQVLLQTDYAGRVSIAASAVERIETDEALEFRLNDGERRAARIAVSDAPPAAAGTAAASSPLTLENVSSAVRAAAPAALLSPMWRTRLDLATVIATGNSDTSAANALLESSMQRQRSVHDLSLLVSQEEAGDVTTKDQIDADYGYKRFLSPRWFAAGQAEYFRDELKRIESQITLGASAGFQAWDHSLSSLSMEAGVSAVLETLVGNDQSQNPAFRWGLDYVRYFSGKRLELFHKHSILVIADSDRGEVIDASTGVRLNVNDRVATHFRIDHQVDTQPPPGVDKIDATYNLVIGFEF